MWTIRANHVQNKIAVGGKLSLANGVLLFTPHGFEKLVDKLDGTAFEAFKAIFGREGNAESRMIAVSDIASVGTLERDFSFSGLSGGGLRQRLSVKLKSGDEEIFVVNDLEDVISHLTEHLG